MGYMHIDNLYKHPEFVQKKRERFTFPPMVYVLEKIHGTSAWIQYKPPCLPDSTPPQPVPLGESMEERQASDVVHKRDHKKASGQPERLSLHSGGENAARFSALFPDQSGLTERLRLLCQEETARRQAQGQTEPIHAVFIHGEAYGGKQQGMAHTYGPELRFTVFDVRINGEFLPVPLAVRYVTETLGLEFVPYHLIPCTSGWLDWARDLPSEQAVRCGVEESRIREGVVVRPICEIQDAMGKRVIYKHKRPEFSETKHPRSLAKVLQIQRDPTKAVEEWVTEIRLTHVLNHFYADHPGWQERHTTEALPEIERQEISSRMEEDVMREGDKELEDTPVMREKCRQATLMLLEQWEAKQGLFTSSSRSSNVSRHVRRETGNAKKHRAPENDESSLSDMWKSLPSNHNKLLYWMVLGHRLV